MPEGDVLERELSTDTEAADDIVHIERDDEPDTALCGVDLSDHEEGDGELCVVCGVMSGEIDL